MKLKTLLIVLSLAALSSYPGARAQQRLERLPPQNPATPPANGGTLYGGYTIGVGDIINIRIAEEDDASGRYQVSDSGDVHLPLLDQPVHAAGLTTFELSKELATALKQQQILVQPYVTVFIERGMTQNVTVVGPVARPGIYPIERPTRLLDVLSMSGGFSPNAGQTVTITHPPMNPKPGEATPPSVSTVDVSKLMSGDNRESNILVRPGDQITVAGASIVYVVGAVVKPGAFSIMDSTSGMSVLRAVALVEGPLPTASLGKAIIVRKSTNENGREEIPVDVGKVMKGKATDPVLLADDILFIPQSGFKQGLRKAGDIAAAAAGQVAGYGLGLRIAR